MPEEERQDTLTDLRRAKAEAQVALEKCPVVAHSLKMDKYKKELETKIIRLERAIETFSKEKVYVQFWEVGIYVSRARFFNNLKK